MSKIIATVILNPFQPRAPENRTVKEISFTNQSIRNIFCDFYPIPNNDVEIVCSINGKIIEKPDWDHKLSPGDNIVFVPVPKGGGGGGSNPIAIIGMIAIAALAYWAAPLIIGNIGSVGGVTLGSVYGGIAVLTSAGTFASGILSAGIMVGGGLLMSALMPSPKIDTGQGETSPTYGWGTFGNATQEGSVLPILIGERRVTPPLIASHNESRDGKNYLSLLYAVSEGPIEDIYGVEINDQPISFYSDIIIDKRLGYDEQEIMPDFNNTFSDRPVNATLKKDDWIMRDTSGTGLDGCQVHISLPVGLWLNSNEGSIKEQSMTLSIQYRRKGTEEWATYVPSEEQGGTKGYVSDKRYDVGEIVSYDNKLYKCTGYFVEGMKKEGSGDAPYGPKEDFYTKTIRPMSFNRGAEKITKIHPTPPPTDTNCWAEYSADMASLVIKGKSMTPISQSYKIFFPQRGQYQIRVKIIEGPPENNPKYGSKAVWAGMSEIVKDGFTYPGTALLGLKILANEQLSGGIPKVSCIGRKVTHSFLEAGTQNLTNPSWASYYLLTNDVWGGGIEESKIQRSDFITWGNFCANKDITCNLYIDRRMTYNEAKDYFCELGRANIIQRGTRFCVIIDKPDVPTQLFTVGNIIKDSFKMNFLPFDDRANCIRVNYYDRESNWERSVLELRTNSFNTENKEKIQDITLNACDRKDVATRHATLLMNYNKHLIRSVSFDVSIDALACTVGDIIKVQHDTTKYGFGGRIVSVDGNKLKIDRVIMLSTSVTYGILLRNDSNDEVEQRSFTVPETKEYDTITLSEPIPEYVKPYSIYSIGPKSIEAKPFRIIAITRSEEFTRKITALEHHDEVYNDESIVDSVPSYLAVSGVFNLVADEVILPDPEGYSSAVATWTGNSSSFNVYYTIDGKEVLAEVTSKNTALIRNLPTEKDITISVAPFNSTYTKTSTTVRLTGEVSAVYENDVYEPGVFATPNMQIKAGWRLHSTTWLQEPSEVVMEFTDTIGG